MKKYHEGKSSDGNELFNIPLETDDSGMIGRECPNEECQPKYFKISTTIPDEISDEIENFSQMDLTCPYCGKKDNMQNFLTQSQLEWVESMLFKDVVDTFQKTLSGSLNTSKQSRGTFSVHLSYKPGSLPSVRHYVEEKLKKEVFCDTCGFKYAIYGISFHCPLCSKGNLIQHFNQSADIIKVLIEESNMIGSEKGQEIRQKLIDNALEDVVTLFETFLKQIYIYKINTEFSNEDAERKIKGIGTNFQRISAAESHFSKNLKFYLYDGISKKDMDFLQEEFLKRHVITHNMGLIDKKYLERAKSYKREGSELEINAEDVLKALKIVQKIIFNAEKIIEESNEKIDQIKPPEKNEEVETNLSNKYTISSKQCIGGLSEEASPIARLLISRHDEQTGREKIYNVDELHKLVPYMSPEEFEDAVDELEDNNLIERIVLGSNRISPTYRLLLLLKDEGLGYNPEDDIKAVAVTVVEKKHVNGKELHEITNINPLRLNHVASYLEDHHYAEVIRGMGTAPYHFAIINATRHTRRFAKENNC